VTAALEAHTGAGGGLVFTTLTVRHNRRQSLENVWGTVSSAWSAIIRTGAWRGGARSVGDVARYGILGWIRVVEVTHGSSGWHVHIHAVILTAAPLTRDDAELLGARMLGRWSAACVRAGMAAPSRQHGIDVQVVSGREAHLGVSKYLTKSGLGGLAQELQGAQTKLAGGGNRGPWQIAAAIHAAVDAGQDPDPQDVAIWSAWERGSRGRRQIAWSAGLRDRLLPDEAELSDEEIADQELAGETLVCFTGDSWKCMRRNTFALLQLLEAVEACADQVAATAAAVRWFEAYDLSYFLPPGTR
jgi:hypothetical protein